MRIGARELLFILLLLSMPVGAWWFVFKPHNLQIAEARAEVEAKKSKLAQLEIATKHITDLPGEIERFSEAIAVVESKLPAAKEVDVVLKEVWQLAVRHGLKIASIHTEKVVKHSRYSEQPMKMEISGDFSGYFAFLQDLERMSRITQVPQMKLTKAKDNEGQMQAEFTVNIYFEPMDAANNKVAQGR